jgi:hypothetical protein
MEVTKCLERTDGIKYAIIPKKSDIQKGDPIMIIKINEKEVLKNVRRKTKRKN